MAQRFLLRLLSVVWLLRIAIISALPPTLSPQHVFQAAQSISSNRKTAILEISRRDFWEWPFYFTNIALGTPPQAFSLVLDLGLGCVAIRSVDCSSDCGRRVLAYNQSASSTCHDLDETFDLPLPGHYGRGPLLQDELHIVSLTLQNATFGSMVRFDGENLMLSILVEFCDGFLGLEPPNASSYTYDRGSIYEPVPQANFLYELTRSDLLEQKVMFLSLPGNPQDMGRLTLGDAPAAIDYRIPLTKQPKPPKIAASWAVDLDSISINGMPYPLEFDFPQPRVASLSLVAGFFLALPDEMCDAIFDYLGASTNRQRDGGRIDCEVVKSLPDITLVIGGQTLVLRRDEYYTESFDGDRRVCVVEIIGNGRSDHATIGLWLFQKFDTVFDMERNEIGLIEH